MSDIEGLKMAHDELFAECATSCEAYNQCRLDEGKYEKKCEVLIKSCAQLIKALETIYAQSQTYWEGNPIRADEVFQIIDDNCRISLSEHRKTVEGG